MSLDVRHWWYPENGVINYHESKQSKINDNSRNRINWHGDKGFIPHMAIKSLGERQKLKLEDIISVSCYNKFTSIDIQK